MLGPFDIRVFRLHSDRPMPGEILCVFRRALYPIGAEQGQIAQIFRPVVYGWESLRLSLSDRAVPGGSQAKPRRHGVWWSSRAAGGRCQLDTRQAMIGETCGVAGSLRRLCSRLAFIVLGFPGRDGIVDG